MLFLFYLSAATTRRSGGFVRNPHGLFTFSLVTFQQEWSHGVQRGAVRAANQAKKLPPTPRQKLLQTWFDKLPLDFMLHNTFPWELCCRCSSLWQPYSAAKFACGDCVAWWRHGEHGPWHSEKHGNGDWVVQDKKNGLPYMCYGYGYRSFSCLGLGENPRTMSIILGQTHPANSVPSMAVRVAVRQVTDKSPITSDLWSMISLQCSLSRYSW